MLSHKDGERVRLVSRNRNGRDHTRRFRDIAAAVAKLCARMLVFDHRRDDAEVINYYFFP